MTAEPNGTAPQNVDEVILIIQSEHLILAKNRKGQVGNQKTKYADLVQVNEVVLARLNQLATIWTCLPHLEDGSFGLHYTLKHVPSATERTGVWPLKLSDNPQQMGSSTTYGRRYALLAVTGVVSEDEDDDGVAAGQQPRQRRQVSPATTEETPPTTSIQRARRPASARADEPLNAGQSAKMHLLFNGMGITKDLRAERLAITTQVIGRDISSSTELTHAEANKLISHLENIATPLPDEPPFDGD